MPFFLSRGRGPFGLRRRTHGAYIPRAASFSFSQPSTGSTAQRSSLTRQQSRGNARKRGSWFPFVSKAHAPNSEGMTSPAKREKPGNAFGLTIVCLSAEKPRDREDSAIDIFSQDSTPPCFTGSIMERFERDNIAGYHEALLAGKQPPRSHSHSTLASEPIDIPSPPPPKVNKLYLEIEDYSASVAAAHRIWSSAFSPPESSDHMLKWEAMVRQHDQESLVETVGEDDSESDEEEELGSSYDDPLVEDNVFEIEMAM